MTPCFSPLLLGWNMSSGTLWPSVASQSSSNKDLCVIISLNTAHMCRSKKKKPEWTQTWKNPQQLLSRRLRCGSQLDLFCRQQGVRFWSRKDEIRREIRIKNIADENYKSMESVSYSVSVLLYLLVAFFKEWEKMKTLAWREWNINQGKLCHWAGEEHFMVYILFLWRLFWTF